MTPFIPIGPRYLFHDPDNGALLEFGDHTSVGPRRLAHIHLCIRVIAVMVNFSIHQELFLTRIRCRRGRGCRRRCRLGCRSRHCRRRRHRRNRRYLRHNNRCLGRFLRCLLNGGSFHIPRCTCIEVCHQTPQAAGVIIGLTVNPDGCCMCDNGNGSNLRNRGIRCLAQHDGNSAALLKGKAPHGELALVLRAGFLRTVRRRFLRCIRRRGYDVLRCRRFLCVCLLR